MLNVGINLLRVHTATVGDLLVLKLEEMAIDNLFACLIEDFQKNFLVIGVDILVELTEG